MTVEKVSLGADFSGVTIRFCATSAFRRNDADDGSATASRVAMFYYFRLEDQIPEDHLLRLLDHHVEFSFVRERLKSFYNSTARPSIDPEVLLRLLLVGYLCGITSERHLLRRRQQPFAVEV